MNNDLPKTIHQAMQKILRAWPSQLSSKQWHPLRQLLLFRQYETDIAFEAALKQRISARLAQFEKDDLEQYDLLHERFFNPITTQTAADARSISIDTLNRHYHKSLEQFNLPLVTEEMALRKVARDTVSRTLPDPSYSKFFGHAAFRQQVVEALCKREAPPIVAVVGIGGIGKTAVSHAIIRQIIEQFVFEVITFVSVKHNALTNPTVEERWKTIQLDLLAQLDPTAIQLPHPQQTTRLQAICRQSPHLILIDNIEEEEMVTFLAAELRRFTSPTKFLLTSRAKPQGVHHLRQFELAQLPKAEAISLMKHDVQEMALTAQIDADNPPYEQFFQRLGGNPLALKIAVRLLGSMSISLILEDLENAQHGLMIQAIYRHIFQKAWERLSKEAKGLLMTMLMTDENGALPAQMQAGSGLNDSQFSEALKRLVACSLLEVRGSAADRRYAIHRLTENFLRNDIPGWF